MKTNKSERREAKRNKSKNGMRVTGKSVFMIQQILIKKGNK